MFANFLVFFMLPEPVTKRPRPISGVAVAGGKIITSGNRVVVVVIKDKPQEKEKIRCPDVNPVGEDERRQLSVMKNPIIDQTLRTSDSLTKTDKDAAADKDGQQDKAPIASKDDFHLQPQVSTESTASQAQSPQPQLPESPMKVDKFICQSSSSKHGDADYDIITISDGEEEGKFKRL